VWRLPRVQGKPHKLTHQQQNEIGLRVRRGERADSLADIFGVDPDVIKQLAW
jgi:hypothetical protein